MGSGDIRVLLGLDLLLSAVFSTVVVWGLSVVGLGSFTTRNVALATVVVAVLTYVVILRE